MLFSSQCRRPVESTSSNESHFQKSSVGAQGVPKWRFFRSLPRLSCQTSTQLSPNKKRISIKKDKSAFHGSFWHFDAFGFGFSYKTLDYICFGLFWNNPRGAQIGTPVPAGGLRKQARCCPSQALDPGATSESWCFEFWPSWDTHLHRSSQQESHWLCFFLSGDFSFSFSSPKEFIYWLSFSCYKFV